MPSDVLITPASSKIDFTDGANATKTLKITGTSFSFDSDLGIGITSPVSKFVVNGGSVNTSTYTSSEARIADGSLHLMKTAAGGIFESVRAMNADTTAGTTVRFIAASTSDPFNNANGGKVFIDAIRTSTNMDLAFSLNDVAGAAPVERVRFTGSGNIGVGTTIPTARIDTLGVRLGRNFSIADRATVRLDANGTAYPSDILFGHTSAANQDSWNGVYWSLSSRASANSNRFYFYRGSGNPAPNNSEAVIMSFDPNLNVGIGFEAPANRLAIAGSVSIGSGYNTAGPTNGLIVEGNVGIGITSPGSKLVISGFGANNTLRFKDGSYEGDVGYVDNTGILSLQNWSAIRFLTGDPSRTEKVRILQNGNVGIGTASPNTLLQVNGANPFIRISSSANSDQGIKISYGNSDTHGLHLLYNPNLATSYIDNTYPVTSSQVYGDIYFRQNVGGTMTTRMTIKADGGNVGIGTTSPSGRLDVHGPVSLRGTTVLTTNFDLNAGNAADIYANIRVLRGASLNDGMFIGYGGAGGPLRFFSNSGTTEFMTIATTGNVGIGNTNPSYKLDVNGSSVFRDTISIGPNIGTISWGSMGGGTGFGIRAESGRALSFGAGASYDHLVINTSGNVGIATTTPYTKAHIYGTLTVDAAGAAVNSFTEGIRLGAATNGYSIVTFGVNAAASSGQITNQWWIGKHGGDNSFNFNSQGGGDVFRILQNGNVGIGNTNPGYKLYVNGTSYFNGALQVNSNITLSGGGDVIINDSDGTGFFASFMDSGVGYIRIDDGGTANGTLNINSGTLFVGPSSGNVGVGTITPTHKLDVRGDVVVKGGATQHSVIRFRRSDSTTDFGYIGFENPALANDTFVISSSGNGNPLKLKAGASDEITFFGDTTEYGRFSSTGNFGIGSNAPNNKLHVNGSTSIGSSYNTAGPTNGLIVEGNVGIGATTAGEKLTVSGNSLIFGSTGAIGTGTAYYLGDTANSRDLAITRVGGSAMAIGRYYPSAWVETIRFTNVGDVGIGISVPLAKLHINSTTSGATLLRADGTNGTLFSVIDDLSDSLMSVNNSAGLPVLEVFADDRVVAGQYGANDFVLVNNKLGLGTNNPNKQLTFAQTNDDAIQIRRITVGSGGPAAGTGISWTWTSATTDNETWAAIRAIFPGNGDTHLTFSNRPANGSTTERMRIQNTGNIGIGIQSPNATLHIKPTTVGANGIILERNASTAKLVYMYEYAADGYIEVRSGADVIISKISGYASTPTYFQSSVGIGTATPSWLLTVYAASAPQFALSNATRSFVLTNNAADGLLSFNYGGANRLQFNTTNQWFNTGNLGIGTSSPAALLQVGTATPTAATGGIQFGDDTGARLYRSASGIITCSGTIAATFSGNLTGNVTGNVSGTAGGETLGTVTGRGNNTSTQLIVSTAAGQAMYIGRQIGGGYSYGSAGIFTALSDNSNGGSNIFFQGYVGSSSNTPGGTLTYSIRADGQIYTTMNSATGVANNSFNVGKAILGALHIANGSGVSGNNNQAAITFQGGTSSEAQAGIYVSNNSGTGTAMGFATTDSYATGPQLFMTANNAGVVNFSRARPTYAGNALVDVAGGQTIAGITYFSNGESMNVYGIRGRFTNEYLHLYNKVGIGHPGGWGQGEGSTPNQGLSTYGGITVAYGTNATSIFYGNVGIGTTSVNARVESYYSSNAITFNYLATNLNGSSPIPVYGFDVTSGAETRSIKAGIGYERHLSNGRGTLHFYNDSANDTASLVGNRTTAGDIKMSLDNNGNLGIGTTVPVTLLQIGTGTPTASANGIQFGDDTAARIYRVSSSTIQVSNNLTVGGTLTESSSIRYKENIKTISAPILPKLEAIRPVTYNKKDNPNNTEYGIIAEELNELFPEFVNKNDKGEVESVNYSRLTVLLIKAVKELKEEIEILKNK